MGGAPPNSTRTMPATTDSTTVASVWLFLGSSDRLDSAR